MKRLALIATLVPILSLAQAQSVPQTIGYQGRLLKSDGTPMNSKVTVTFRIYAQAVGDSTLALWSEKQDVTPNSGGFYAVFLGAVTPFGANVFNGEDRWLGLAIGSDNELVPRQKIASVAYSMRAGHAVSADSATNAANVIGGTVNASSISGGSISAASLTVTGGPLRVNTDKVTANVPMAYVTVGNCPTGDTAVQYRTMPTTCSDSTCRGSCTTAYHGWSATNSGQESCGYSKENCRESSSGEVVCRCEPATCTATRYVLCNP